MKSLMCKLGLHKYEVYKEEPLSDVRGNIVGNIIISRCSVCGKIHTDKIHTISNL